MEYKKNYFYAAFFVGLLCLASCQSKEEKVISDLNGLSEYIEKNGQDFDARDWKEVLEEWENIHQEMEECEFTKKQLQEVGRADGKLTAVFAKEGAKAFGRNFFSILEDFSLFAEGFQEGVMEDDHQEEDFDAIGDQIISTLKEIEDGWKR